MKIRVAVPEDLPALLDIYNYEVIHGTSTFDTEPKTLEERKIWFDEHNVGSYPLYVAEIDGQVAGYASLSPYRTKDAYRSTVELSIYIDPDFRGQGIASTLMETILDIARQDDTLHTVISVITAGNQASERLHSKFGFEFCGCMREVGIKFGNYLDIVNYQLFV